MLLIDTSNKLIETPMIEMNYLFSIHVVNLQYVYWNDPSAIKFVNGNDLIGSFVRFCCVPVHCWKQRESDVAHLSSKCIWTLYALV